jgi:hypothetical protein
MAKEKKTAEKTTPIEVAKIDIRSKETINATLELGQVVRNGSGRIFEIVGLDDTQIYLKSHNVEKGKGERTLGMSRKVFVELYHLKNYDQIRSVKTARKEIMEDKITGADRFLL